jgi:hypothetical protein
MKPGLKIQHLVMMIAAGFVLAACAPRPMVRPVPAEPAPPPQTEVYFYPLKNQDAKQQDRDRYECYLWAKKQTGFEPSAPQLAPHQRFEVVPGPAPGHDTAVGAITGAMIGSMMGGPHDSGEGAVVGMMAGAILGASSDAARQQEAASAQAYVDQQSYQRNSTVEQKASNYRRAMTACLEGRGYSVR